MGIKHAVLRTHDGHVYDLLKPGCKATAGVGGVIETLATGSGEVRVRINGGQASAGRSVAWPATLDSSPAKLLIEQVDSGRVIDKKEADVVIEGLPAAEAEQRGVEPSEPSEPPPAAA